MVGGERRASHWSGSVGLRLPWLQSERFDLGWEPKLEGVPIDEARCLASSGSSSSSSALRSAGFVVRVSLRDSIR